MSTTRTLYRAADDDIVIDSASFAETLETARVYIDNPGHGGSRLWACKVPLGAAILDLSDMTARDALEALCEAAGTSDPGAIGPDEYAPRVSYQLRDAGVEWVRVSESYPAGTITWIWVGGDDPEMTEVE